MDDKETKGHAIQRKLRTVIAITLALAKCSQTNLSGNVIVIRCQRPTSI